MIYTKKLQDIGLKKEEAEVYLACLKMGMAKVSELAEEIDVPRTSIYIYIKNLLAKGYLKKSKKQGVEYFIPIEPKHILEENKERIENFSDIIPQLEKFVDFPGKKPKIEYFDTTRGFSKLYEAMLKMEYKQIPYLIESGVSTEHIVEKLGWEFLYKWEKKFLEKKVVTQGIITKDTIAVLNSAPEKVKEIMRQRPSTVRVVDEKEFPFSISLYLLYPRYIFIIVPQQNFVLTLEDKDVYNSLVVLYKALFEKAERLDTKEAIL